MRLYAHQGDLTGIELGSAPGWVLAGAAIDMDFANGLYFGDTLANLLLITRASNATDLVPSSASGYAYNTFSSNVLTISPTFGLYIFEARTNQLLNSTAPVTQTTASLGTGSYTLWVNGSGSALASGATATITGASSASNGSPNTITVTVAGTVTVTVTGFLNFFQLEAGAFGTSGIVTAGATAARAKDLVSMTGLFLAGVRGASGFVFVSAQIAQAGITLNNNRAFGIAGNDATHIYASSNTAASTYNGTTGLSATVGSGSWAAGLKGALGWSAAGRSLVANNGTLVSDANLINGSQTLLGDGGAADSPFNGLVSRAAMGTSRPSNTALKALTQ